MNLGFQSHDQQDGPTLVGKPSYYFSQSSATSVQQNQLSNFNCKAIMFNLKQIVKFFSFVLPMEVVTLLKKSDTMT